MAEANAEAVNQNAEAVNQNGVTLKLPFYWTSKPRVWFRQTETQFALRQITADETKYYYVVAAIGVARIFDWRGPKPQITCKDVVKNFDREIFCRAKMS